MKIVIISASVRTGRMSHRAALFFKNFIEKENMASAEILDLQQYQFPIFDERLKFQKNPLPEAVEFSQKIRSADGVIIVTPEYNGAYPASLKNVIDLLNEEWKKKPVSISMVSSGAFGGSQVITSLQFALWKIQAWTVPVVFPVPKIGEAFDEQGAPIDKESMEKRARSFINELLWYIEAKKRMTA